MGCVVFGNTVFVGVRRVVFAILGELVLRCWRLF